MRRRNGIVEGTKQEVIINKVIVKPPKTDEEKVNAAKEGATAALYYISVNNDTTAEEILNAVNAAMSNGVAASWHASEGFHKKAATTSENGSITGTISLKLNGQTQEIIINKVITKLPKTNAEKVEAVKAAATAAVYQLSVNNSTTASAILNAVNRVLENGVTASWKSDAGFHMTEATTTDSGRVTGTIELMLNGVVQQITIDRVIAKLPTTNAEKVEAARQAASAAISELLMGNGTTAADLMNTIASVLENGVTVSWKSDAGFTKTEATTTDSGRITGTIELKLNGAVQQIRLDRVIAKLPTTGGEKVAAAKKEASTALYTLSVTNDTTAADILSALNSSMSNGVTASWKSGAGFKKAAATTSENGTITGTLELRLGGDMQEITLNKVIAKLPVTDIEKVSAAKEASLSALYAFSVSNSTSADDILNAVRAVIKNGVNATWKNGAGFKKTAATTTSDGTITGIIELTLNEGTQELNVNKLIAKLPTTDAEKLTAVRAEVITALEKVQAGNDTTAEDVLKEVNAVLSNVVTASWKNGFGFVKNNATSTEGGSITGTILLTLNKSSQEAVLNKSIAKLPKTDEDKTSAAKDAAISTLYKMEITNATTAENVLDAVNAAISKEVTAVWKIEDGFKKTLATTSEEGRIIGTIELRLNGARQEIPVYKIISKLPKTDAEKVSEDRKSAIEAIYEMTVTNATTQDQIMDAVKAAMKNGTNPKWKAGAEFKLAEATDVENGSITGILTLTLNQAAAEITVKKDIQRLPYNGTNDIKLTLVGMIQKAEGIVGQGQGHFSSQSWKLLQTAIGNARKAYLNNNASKFDCLNALEVLTRSMNGLKNYSIPDKNRVFTVGSLRYQVTKSASNGTGTVTVKGPKSKNYTSVKIPSTITIDSYTFQVTAVSENAFNRNKKLKTVTIGDKVKTIGYHAFYKNPSLKKVTFGKSVTTISRYALYNNPKLNSIQFKGKNLASVGTNAFKKSSAKMVVKVPSSRLKAYKALLNNKGFQKGVKFTK